MNEDSQINDTMITDFYFRLCGPKGPCVFCSVSCWCSEYLLFWKEFFNLVIIFILINPVLGSFRTRVLAGFTTRGSIQFAPHVVEENVLLKPVRGQVTGCEQERNAALAPKEGVFRGGGGIHTT